MQRVHHSPEITAYSHNSHSRVWAYTGQMQQRKRVRSKVHQVGTKLWQWLTMVALYHPPPTIVPRLLHWSFLPQALIHPNFVRIAPVIFFSGSSFVSSADPSPVPFCLVSSFPFPTILLLLSFAGGRGFDSSSCPVLSAGLFITIEFLFFFSFNLCRPRF